MKTLISLGLLLSGVAAFAAPSVPDFTVQVGQEQNAKMRGWLLNFLPPVGHHFNADAPMSVTALSNQVTFIKVGAVKEHVGFRSSDQKLVPGTEAMASIFLCDDAKTFCIKKTLTFALTVNSDLKVLDFTAKAEAASHKPKGTPTPGAPIKKPGKKDLHGFWDNNLGAALAESGKSGKPILVDFYGIWCPPCNLFNETVFPSLKFKTAAKNWVLLKMDADAPESFELKSHFKIGGYPTILAIASSTKPEIAYLNEIDRIVGYYPANEFVELMSKAYSQRNLGLAGNLPIRRKAYLEALKDVIEINIEKKEPGNALPLAEEGSKAEQNTHYFTLTALFLHANEQAEILKQPASLKTLEDTWANRIHEDPDTLLRLVDILTSHAELFSKTQIAWANDVLDSLAKNVVNETLSVPGAELSIADIDALRVDVAEALADPALTKAAYVRTVESYQKMIKQFHGEDSRGLNLELAYYLWKSGAVDQAKALYSKFIKKYPSEFTFYYAASKMYLDLKDYTTARDDAEKAVNFAYGDNKLRSMERLVRVLAAQGETDLAAKRGKELLDTVEMPNSNLVLRTGRYIQALKKAVDEAGKGKL
jgi:thiol-disulfide isomerase/thioredoxin